MGQRPRASLLKYPGTNCDRETARALRTVGFEAHIEPFSAVDRETVEASDLIVFSGGFSYGDYVKAGRLARLETQARLGDQLTSFRDEGGYLLGICNGFQILLELGLLPEGSLVQNESRRFICRWTPLEQVGTNEVFLNGLPDRFELPIAHMEGRFVSGGRSEEYIEDGLVPLQYAENPNGSEAGIAGLRDETGRVLGMMPHPERFLAPKHHYSTDWNERDHGWGFYLFQSLYESVVEDVEQSENETLETV
jgi:phosphoribosylformylglycinamidine synthase